jgi:hypothetical protein
MKNRTIDDSGYMVVNGKIANIIGKLRGGFGISDDKF